MRSSALRPRTAAQFVPPAARALASTSVPLAEDAGAQAEAQAAAMIAGSRASHAALKRGLALAARGIAREDAQDRSFDALLGSAELAAGLAQRKAAR